MPDREKSMDTIDYSHLESLLSDEDRILYSGMQGDQAREFLITNPKLDPTTARNLRVRYLLAKAVEAGRINPSDISLHDQLFHEIGVFSMKEDRTENDDQQLSDINQQLRTLWTRADPTNSSHRLAMEYAMRSSNN